MSTNSSPMEVNSTSPTTEYKFCKPSSHDSDSIYTFSSGAIIQQTGGASVLIACKRKREENFNHLITKNNKHGVKGPDILQGFVDDYSFNKNLSMKSPLVKDTTKMWYIRRWLQTQELFRMQRKSSEGSSSMETTSTSLSYDNGFCKSPTHNSDTIYILSGSIEKETEGASGSIACKHQRNENFNNLKTKSNKDGVKGLDVFQDYVVDCLFENILSMNSPQIKETPSVYTSFKMFYIRRWLQTQEELLRMQIKEIPSFYISFKMWCIRRWLQTQEELFRTQKKSSENRSSMEITSTSLTYDNGFSKSPTEYNDSIYNSLDESINNGTEGATESIAHKRQRQENFNHFIAENNKGGVKGPDISQDFMDDYSFNKKLFMKSPSVKDTSKMWYIRRWLQTQEELFHMQKSSSEGSSSMETTSTSVSYDNGFCKSPTQYSDTIYILSGSIEKETEGASGSIASKRQWEENFNHLITENNKGRVKGPDISQDVMDDYSFNKKLFLKSPLVKDTSKMWYIRRWLQTQEELFRMQIKEIPSFYISFKMWYIRRWLQTQEELFRMQRKSSEGSSSMETTSTSLSYDNGFCKSPTQCSDTIYILSGSIEKETEGDSGLIASKWRRGENFNHFITENNKGRVKGPDISQDVIDDYSFNKKLFMKSPLVKDTSKMWYIRRWLQTQEELFCMQRKSSEGSSSMETTSTSLSYDNGFCKSPTQCSDTIYILSGSIEKETEGDSGSIASKRQRNENFNNLKTKSNKDGVKGLDVFQDYVVDCLFENILSMNSPQIKETPSVYTSFRMFYIRRWLQTQEELLRMQIKKTSSFYISFKMWCIRRWLQTQEELFRTQRKSSENRSSMAITSTSLTYDNGFSKSPTEYNDSIYNSLDESINNGTEGATGSIAHKRQKQESYYLQTENINGEFKGTHLSQDFVGDCSFKDTLPTKSPPVEETPSFYNSAEMEYIKRCLPTRDELFYMQRGSLENSLSMDITDTSFTYDNASCKSPTQYNDSIYSTLNESLKHGTEGATGSITSKRQRQESYYLQTENINGEVKETHLSQDFVGDCSFKDTFPKKSSPVKETPSFYNSAEMEYIKRCLPTLDESFYMQRGSLENSLSMDITDTSLTNDNASCKSPTEYNDSIYNSLEESIKNGMEGATGSITSKRQRQESYYLQTENINGEVKGTHLSDDFVGNCSFKDTLPTTSSPVEETSSFYNSVEMEYIKRCLPTLDESFYMQRGSFENNLSMDITDTSVTNVNASCKSLTQYNDSIYSTLDESLKHGREGATGSIASKRQRTYYLQTETNNGEVKGAHLSQDIVGDCSFKDTLPKKNPPVKEISTFYSWAEMKDLRSSLLTLEELSYLQTRSLENSLSMDITDTSLTNDNASCKSPTQYNDSIYNSLDESIKNGIEGAGGSIASKLQREENFNYLKNENNKE
ncbi:hypothetical protein FQA39_LY04481 [Lamprigera yunnana]|nr:hypothetical protein FQA39_LY04481 [Lamprigera yunnana]